MLGRCDGTDINDDAVGVVPAVEPGDEAKLLNAVVASSSSSSKLPSVVVEHELLVLKWLRILRESPEFSGEANVKNEREGDGVGGASYDGESNCSSSSSVLNCTVKRRSGGNAMAKRSG
jgi:hypothetical protein